MLWLVLLGSINRVVDKSETGALATSEAGLRSEDAGSLGGSLHKHVRMREGTEQECTKS